MSSHDERDRRIRLVIELAYGKMSLWEVAISSGLYVGLGRATALSHLADCLREYSELYEALHELFQMRKVPERVGRTLSKKI